MNRLARFLRSSIGAKVAMAVSGLLLSLFALGHVTGNFLIYRGRDAFNHYAETLQGLGPLLWVVRAVLLAILVLHVALGIRLKLDNRRARPARYVREMTVQASIASRTMVLTGFVVLAFLVLHILHFTLGVVQPSGHALTETVVRDGQDVVRHDAWGMVVTGFRQSLGLVVVYALAMLVLGLHLSHGLHSLFQSLGLRHPVYTPIIEWAGRILAWVIALAYISIPLTIWLGLAGTEGTPS